MRPAATPKPTSAVDNQTPETTRRHREVIDYCETELPSHTATVIWSELGWVLCIAGRPCSMFIIMLETPLLEPRQLH